MSKPALPESHVPAVFSHTFGPLIKCVLGGYDRLRFRGTLRPLFSPNGMRARLCSAKILLKDFAQHAQDLSHQIGQLARQMDQHRLAFVPHGIMAFRTPRVMRFLGHPVPVKSGKVNGRFQGPARSDRIERHEGVCLRHGVRNADPRRHLYPLPAPSAQPARRRSAAVSRKLRLLRAHGLMRKMPGSHRYLLTPKGRRLITLLLAARNSDVQQLTALTT